MLRACASWFRSCAAEATEDKAHWANVYNAENCDKAAALIERQNREIAELNSDLTEQVDVPKLMEDIARLTRELAEARAALKQLVADYGDVPDATDSDAQSVMDRARKALASHSPAGGERR